MKLLKTNKEQALVSLVVSVLVIGIIITASSASATVSRMKQKTFSSPEQAVQALLSAVRSGQTRDLGSIFGSRYITQFSSGDWVRDKTDRELFIKAFEEKNSLEKEGHNKITLHVGHDGWPFPFPLIKKNSSWLFDSETGKEELMNRRIGRNELRVIETMRAYVTAQREYAEKDRIGNGMRAFSQKIISTPGVKDGLYWKAKDGEEVSPMGPLVAMAAREGYTRRTATGKAPFQGYYFRVLTAQGDKAPGGAYNYVVKGNMILGFGLIAYPAKYGSSGIMTFIVNQQGIVYQKDLGKRTVRLVSAIKEYNPDEGWTEAEPPATAK